MSDIKIKLTVDENLFKAFQPHQHNDVSKEAYEIIGRILDLWNRIECDVIYLSAWMHPIFKAEMPKKWQQEPRGLDGRLKFLKYLFEQYEELSIFKAEYEPHKQNIDAIKNERHHIVHWPILNIEAVSGGFLIKMMNPEKLPRKLETKEISKNELLVLANKLGVIGLSFGFFASSFDQRLKVKLAQQS